MSHPGEQFVPGPIELVAGGATWSFGLTRRVTALVCTCLHPPTGARETLEGAVLARKDRRWFTRNPWKEPPIPGWPATRSRAVASAFGTVWVRLEPVAHVVWIGTEPIALPEEDNIVFLDRPSHAPHTLELVGSTRIQAEFTPLSVGARTPRSQLQKHLRDVSNALLGSADVRRFVDA